MQDNEVSEEPEVLLASSLRSSRIDADNQRHIGQTWRVLEMALITFGGQPDLFRGEKGRNAHL
ncbi:MAG: hypothetical protein CMJ64_10005 [Planctomycetaceae bacterium]|nr:hypothetical protein [Planctomycetaceae bacterium]